MRILCLSVFCHILPSVQHMTSFRSAPLHAGTCRADKVTTLVLQVLPVQLGILYSGPGGIRGTCDTIWSSFNRMKLCAVLCIFLFAFF